MLIQMLTTAAGPELMAKTGEQVDLAQSLAKRLIAAGYAVKPKDDKDDGPEADN